jgi:hypothetical protein
MKVQIGNKTYLVDWAHYIPADKQPRNTGDVHSAFGTDCFIYNGSLDSLFTSGVAGLHSTDRFVKEQGRKVSLTRALENGNFSRAEREVFWRAYFNRRVA